MTITPDQAKTLLDGVTPGPWTAEEYDDYPGDRGVPIIGGGEPGTMEAHLTAYALTLNDPDQCERDGALIAAAPDLAQTVIDQAEKIDALSSALRFMYETYNTDIARLAAELPDDAVVYDAESKQPDGEAVMNAAILLLERAREADQ